MRKRTATNPPARRTRSNNPQTDDPVADIRVAAAPFVPPEELAREGATDFTALTREERLNLEHLEEAITDGIELFEWCQEHDDNKRYREQHPVVRVVDRQAANFAFRDEAVLRRGLLPVMGVVLDMVYDYRPAASVEHGKVDWLSDQVREYALRYFMRIADGTTEPQFVLDPPKDPPPPFLEPFSMWPAKVARNGMGYQQLYYKKHGDPKVGKFSAAERYKITDVRELGHEHGKYDWIVVKVRLFDLNLPVQIWDDRLTASVPLGQEVYAVLVPELVINEESDELPDGIAGRFGYGYSVIPNPARDSLLAYSPAELLRGVDHFTFSVTDEGKVRVRESFVTNEPAQILDPGAVVEYFGRVMNKSTGGLTSPLVSMFMKPARTAIGMVAPLYQSINLLGALTGNWTRTALSISEERLFRDLMGYHFLVQYYGLAQTQFTWNKIEDWTVKEDDLPAWVTEGGPPADARKGQEGAPAS